MSADDYRPALVPWSPGHGAPADRVRPGSGSGGVSNVEAAMRSRASAIDWAAVAPYLAEDEERRLAARAARQEASS